MTKRVLLIFVSLLICLFSFACDGSNLSDKQMATQKFELLFDALKTRNKEGVSTLFSQQVKNDLTSFYSSVEELFDYVEGDIISFNDSGALSATGLKEDGYVERSLTASYEVITSVDTYKMSFLYITENDKFPEKTGINSLYVIRASEDYTDIGTYWGDGNDTPGIHVKVKNETLYFSKAVSVCNNFLKAINEKNSQTLTELFSPDVIANSPAFDENIISLFELCKGTIDVTQNVAERQVFEQTEHTKRINSSYYIETDTDSYTLWISYVYKNTETPENVGIVSVYIGNAPYVHFDETVYDGDGKQTPGINIVTVDK